MNYEERYNKALERAKKMLASKRSVIVKRQALETIFPELKESEDERIRKGILNYLVSRGFSHEWITWLEKQGEKTNPYSGISFEYNGHTWGMCARDNGVDILLDCKLIYHFEERGEQNLANSAKICKEDEEDWSEKDEKILKIIINDIQERHPKATFSTRYMIDWLKSLKERFGCEVNCTTKKNEE